MQMHQTGGRCASVHLLREKWYNHPSPVIHPTANIGVGKESSSTWLQGNYCLGSLVSLELQPFYYSSIMFLPTNPRQPMQGLVSFPFFV